MPEKVVGSAYFYLILAAVSFVTVWVFHPIILKMAHRWNIVDNPDARKLQRNPVPAMGGVAVFTGIAVGVAVILAVAYNSKLLIILSAMAILMFIGTLDDKFGMPVWSRFLVELFVVLGMILFNGNYIDNFHGIFGLYSVPDCVAIPFSVFVGVGIINAINLMDGIDGYSSGFLMVSCLLFFIVFHVSGIYGLSMLSLLSAAALIPFYLHNVFGSKSKMFIGDGGTLMMGTMMVSCVFSVLKTGSMCGQMEEAHNVSLVAFCLAVLSIPVIDTLRVMTYRMAKGLSPFKPDRTHLHHLFIDLHFSHFAAGSICISLNGIVLISWIVSWMHGASLNVQFAVVCVAMIMVDPVLYAVLRNQEKRGTALSRRICRFADKERAAQTKFWRWMNKYF